MGWGWCGVEGGEEVVIRWGEGRNQLSPFPEMMAICFVEIGVSGIKMNPKMHFSLRIF